MGTRSAQKQMTRLKIIQAALEKMNEDDSFANVSMREVAKAAGIAPTSFYRHFKDMEELGLVLVDEAGLSLRQLIRDAREKAMADSGNVLRVTVETFMSYMRANPELFTFLMRARVGASKVIRSAINQELQHIVRELAEDIERAGSEKRRPIAHPKLVAESVVAIVFSVGFKAFDMHEEEQPFLTEVIIQQLRMLYLGAELLTKRAERMEGAL